MMKSETISILVRCQYWGAPADTAQLQIVRVDTAEKVRLRNGHFVLHISVDDAAPAVRCLVRHIPSGREVYVQTGSKIRDFLEACLLQ